MFFSFGKKGAPDELALHQALEDFNSGDLLGWGPAAETEEHTMLQLKEILHKHGVPTHRSEERALTAIQKIGLPGLLTALQSKNPWAALKALGSLPRVNFLWVKPDELEKQIKFRAHAKFKAAPSERKKSSSASVASAYMDPAAH
eukprot:s1330_g14.t1